SIGLGQDDPRIMGGTQDNGTPLFELNDQQLGTMSQDISSGDGGYSFFTENFLYVSTQRQTSTGSNRVVRIPRDNSTSPTNVTPLQATTAFFINPYAVDPNDEGIMYYPAGDSLFRNTNVDQGTQTEQNWELMSAAELSNHNISALAVSTSPANVLYYGGSNNSGVPVVKRLDNASVSNSKPVDISIGQAEAGSFVHDIAINPLNANDVLVVMSNYGVVGLYHTSNGGSTWEAVEGNLAGSGDRFSSDAGPSMRTATIVPGESGPIYVLGTSTGLYATQSLNGDQTQWGRESAADSDGNPDIGFSVVENITSRFSDGDVAVGTHGRGIFVGDFQGQVAASDFPLISLNPTEGRAGDEVTITATNFQFSTNPDDNTVLFGPIPAEVTQATSNQLTVTVPRGTLPPMSDNQTIFVSVDNNNGTNPQDVPFKILDPNTFTVKQNYPNPFAATTKIPFDLPTDAEVTISVYNMSGQQVLQPLKQASYNAGTYNEQIDLSQLASGIYIYRIYVKANSGGDDAMQSKKMTLIK
ncbi:MAG TPA: T9SS type A sorting domain-containing protein, partial [Bacteroidales bacterium]|nr:T9SS type A sorting domain-containing protein [Bacteroidales bacterium]